MRVTLQVGLRKLLERDGVVVLLIAGTVEQRDFFVSGGIEQTCQASEFCSSAK